MIRFVNYFFLILVFGVISCNSSKKINTVSKESTFDKNSTIQIKYAELLQVSSEFIENLTLYKFIDKWIGVEYKFGGLTFEGVDCSGFANILYKEVYKKDLPRSSNEIAKIINPKPKNKLSEGDLLIFDIDGKKNSHVGIFLANDRFIHASTSKGVIISTLNLPYYQKTFSKAGSI